MNLQRHEIHPRAGAAAVTLVCMMLGVMGLASPAEACVFDAECPLGSRCYQDPVAYKGRCVDRLSGGQVGSDKLFEPFASQGVRGKTCTFDVDCRAFGARCLKRKGFLSGVCFGN